MTDYSDYLARDDVRFIYYAFISGIPYVFSNAPQPTGWTLGSGYTWSQSLVYFRSSSSGGRSSTFRSIGQEIDWQRGVTIAGSLDLKFAYDPEDPNSTWFGLLVPSTRTTYYLDPSWIARPQTSRLLFLDVGSMAADDLLHIGEEAVQVTYVDAANNYADVTRAAFQSDPQWYGKIGSGPTGGFVEATSWPDVWRGRIVSIWRACCGVDADGNTAPLSSSVQGTYDQEIFRGPISEVQWERGTPGLTIQSQSLEQLLARPVASRARVYRPGPTAAGEGWVYVEAGANDWVEYDNGELSGRVELAEGLYNLGTLMNAIVDGLHDDLLTGPVPVGIQFTWQVMVPEDSPGEAKVMIGAVQRIAGAIPLERPMTLRVTTASQPRRAALRAVGATQDVIVPAGTWQTPYDFLFGFTQFSYVEVDSPIPHYYLGKSNTRLYYHGLTGFGNVHTADPPYQQGTRRRNGKVDYSHVRFGEHEVLEVQFRQDAGGHFIFLDETYPTLTYGRIRNRGLCGTERAYITVPRGELEDEAHELRVGIAFTDTWLMDALRWLLCSNGDANTTATIWPATERGWNVLPNGYGAGIPTSYVDLDSFEAIHARHQPFANGWWLEGDETLRDVLAKVCLAYGLAALPTYGSGAAADMGGRYLLGLKEASPPPLADSAVATIDEDWFNTSEAPPSVDRSERDVVNKIVFKFGYDPLNKEYSSEDNSFSDAQSIAKYGESRPLELELPWLRGAPGGIANTLADLAAWTFSTKGIPHAIYQLPYVCPAGWAIGPLDVVSVTHPGLPDYRGGGLGLTAEPMQVIANSQEAGPSSKTYGALTCLVRTHFRARPYVLCLRLKALVSGSEYSVAYNENDGGFTRLEDPDTSYDINYYSVAASSSWIVRCFIPGVDSIQSRKVTAVDTSAFTITLSAALTLSPISSVVVEFTTYDNALGAGGLGAGQEDYAYVADSETLQITDAAAASTGGPRWW